MRLGEIDFPNSLLDAQERGELVIFAGAGVSIPPPSNLPDFKELAIDLADGTATLDDGEPLDRFLGRLSEDLNIHKRTCERLCQPGSEPNPLHLSTLKL